MECFICHQEVESQKSKLRTEIENLKNEIVVLKEIIREKYLTEVKK
jgi:hypothetical protein